MEMKGAFVLTAYFIITCLCKVTPNITAHRPPTHFSCLSVFFGKFLNIFTFGYVR